MIPLIRPDICFQEVEEDLQAILHSGRLTGGPFVERFEKIFAEYVRVKHAISTTSATTALHLTLTALGIGPGDEVLVSDFTFPASGNAIIQTGAAPVLVDCFPDRFDLDVEDAKRKISLRTKAIMPVSPFGQPADMPAILKIAEQNNLLVIEDAACALGAERDGERCGAWKNAGCFSFHPRKVITTGEGGMITTDDDHLAEKIKILKNHGSNTTSNKVTFETNGFNCRMSEIQAALGIAQMKRLDVILLDRQATGKKYLEKLKRIPQIRTPISALLEQCTFQSFVLLLDVNINRDKVIRIMNEEGIETTLGTYAMHSQPAFARFKYHPGDLQYSWSHHTRSLTLPLLPRMDESLIDRVLKTLTMAIEKSHSSSQA